jgi:hypothetical protein
MTAEVGPPAAQPDEAYSVVTYEPENASGPSVELAQRLGRWFGWSVQLAYVTLEVERHENVRVLDAGTGATLSRSTFDRSDETVFIPLSGQFDFHFLPPGRYDLYASALLGYSWYDELYGGWVDDHFFYGWDVGLDVGVTKQWAISAVARFLQVEAEPREGGYLLRQTAGEINVDPWQLAVGLAYRFGSRGK